MKILVFGSANIDYVYSLPHIVKEGETLKCSDLNLFPGGKGLNQAIALSKAGATVSFAGAVGEDGEILRRTLADNHIDISHLARSQKKTGHAIIQVTDTAENSIFVYPGANGDISETQIDRVLSAFQAGDILLLQNEISNLPHLVDAGFRKGLSIVLNPSPINETIFEIDLHKISYLILNRGEARDIYLNKNKQDAHLSGLSDTESIDVCLAYLLSQYPQLKIMLTLGTDGCIYKDSVQTVYQPIYKTKAVDTTAAGDTFTGYFISELSKGTAMPEILKIASCASSIAVSRHGAAPSIPYYQEVISSYHLTIRES